MVSTARLCIICKGSRRLCGLKRCPILESAKIKPKIEKAINKEFFGPSTGAFVGRINYPNVFVGPMSVIGEENVKIVDNPKKWFRMDYERIIEARSFALRSKQKESVFSRSDFVEKNQELCLSIKPVDVELEFKKKPTYRFEFSDIVQPMGPSAFLEKFRITENPRIPKRIDRIVSDDIKAEDASYMLYRRGEDVYKVSTILSSGILGDERNKKMVPTRWSITATDDIIFRNLVKEVKQFPEINEFRVYSNEFLHNHFEILFIPGQWEYENFEAWAPGSFWSRNLKKPEILEEYEPYKGRTTYADKEGGGYYAARIGVVEALNRIRKQAKVIVFREVYEGYIVPLGVWQVRENVRNAFKQKYESFDTLKEALIHINSRLRLDIKEYIKRSKILQQKRLNEFIGFKNYYIEL